MEKVKSLVSMASEAVLKMLLVSRRLRVIDTDGYGLYATDVAIQILQLIAEEFLFCSTQDTKLRKFGLLGWNHVSTLLGLNLKLSSDIGDLQLDVSSHNLFDSKAYTMLFVYASSVDEVLSLEDVRNDSEVVGSSGRCTNGGESANVHPAFVFLSLSLGSEGSSFSQYGLQANVHPAFVFCLYHLGVKDLLSVSMVCKSLHTTICDDSLLWKHIHICQPLKEKITEDALLRLTERAQGTLQCLRLVDCCRITDDCLKRVLDCNPQVVKLGVPGCTRITVDGILSILRDLKSVGKLQVKHLEIGGLFGVTKDHFDELFDLLNIDGNVSTAGKKAMQKKEDAILADQLGRMSVSRKRSYYHLFDFKAIHTILMELFRVSVYHQEWVT